MGAHTDRVGRRGSWFGYVVVISLAFLLAALYQADYLVVPRIRSYPAIAISLLFLFLGFIGQSLAWHALLERTEFPASVRDCIAGTGLSVFARYVPGKILTVVGRAAYLSQRMEYPLGRLSMLSLQTQLLSLWVALSVGLIALALADSIPSWKWIYWGLWVVISVVIFSDRAHDLGSCVLGRISGRDITLPRLEFASAIGVLPWFAGFWLCWSAGFHFLIVGLHTGTVLPTVGLAFPVATALGILALPLPGGLGLREGVLTGLLVILGLEVADATTYAIAARLWFLLGESFMFLVGWQAHRGHTRSP
jgi:uncharacterized membrane protein YbhN (UPF0104 family)